jgi:A/G-specific adenine glycosylase
MKTDLPDRNWKQRFRRRIFHWYAQNARTLPWRGPRDPYSIWISEIMLQQTQVATVESFFPRFLERFPTIASLAAAEETEVLRYWEGLGYYRRAVQMHRAARAIVRHHGGRFPETFEEMLSLPGIGRYTAGAILSIAHDRRLPVLEANTVRLFSRLLAFQGDPTGGEGNRLLWKMAESVLPKKNVGTFNQALMELGSLVCVPKNPPCRECPVFPLCGAFAEGKQNELPRPKSKKKPTSIEELAVLVESEGKILMIRYPEGVRWAGLWDFPRIPLDACPSSPSTLWQTTVENRLFQLTGMKIALKEYLKTFRHSVTRYRITLYCYRGALRKGSATGRRASPPIEEQDQGAIQRLETRWIPKSQLIEMPLNTTGRKMCPLV